MTIGLSIIICTLLTPIIAKYYQKQLATSESMGGAISGPKLFWLFYALSAYYIWPVIMFFYSDVSLVAYNWIIAVFGFMIFRSVIQSVLMYQTKSWSPWMGVSFNIVAAGICYTGLAGLYTNNPDINWLAPQPILLFILAYCFTIDSYYAWFFWKNVGEQTKGDNPIWFANSEDPKFNTVNKITFINNIVLSALLITLIFSSFS